MKIEAKIKNGYASLFINDVEIPFCSEIIKVEVPHSYENGVITFGCNGVEIFEDEYNTLHIMPTMPKTASEKLDDIIVRAGVQNILDLLTRHTALLNDIKMMLPSEKTAEWISVRKQNPEDYEEVIATVRYDYGNKQEYEVLTGVRYSKEEGWEWAYEAGADYWESINGVVAWQPLPKPYEVKR